jgi:protein-disulfide isomerase
MKNPWVVVGVLAVVLFGGVTLVVNLFASEDRQEIAEIDSNITIVPHIKGNPEAAVELVEYSDFQCPACASFQPILAEVMTQFDGAVKLEFRHFPLQMHQHARAAALAAEAAGQQDKFFEYHDILFTRQSEWSGMLSPKGTFSDYAEELGLDVGRFEQDMRSKVLRDRIQDDLNNGISLTGPDGEPLITGTPSFFLNGEKMQFTTLDEFVTQIALAVDPSMVPASTAPAAGQGGEVKFGI